MKNFDAAKDDAGMKVLTKMTESRIEVSEYIPVDVEGEVKDREQNFLNGKDDDESDEDFSWLEERMEETEVTKETYFTMIN